MGVELRITGPGVPVVVPGGGNSENLVLSDSTVSSVAARTGHCNLAFQKRNDLGNRLVMRVDDQRLGACVGDTPQHGDGLGDTEREVEARDCPPPIPAFLDGHDLRLIPRHLRRIIERGLERRNLGEVKSRGSSEPAPACFVSFALMAAHLPNIGPEPPQPGRLADSDLVCAPLDCFSYRQPFILSQFL